jgi:hypothetical protein
LEKPSENTERSYRTLPDHVEARFNLGILHLAMKNKPATVKQMKIL